MARVVALRHRLTPELVCAVVEQESSWRPWAIRYEPKFFDRYILPQVQASAKQKGGLRDVTEARARAFSWGLMQVMGQTAREHGFKGPLPRLCEPITGLDVGCRVFAAKLAAAKRSGGVHTVKKALLLWNGGARKEYADEVLERVDTYVTA